MGSRLYVSPHSPPSEDGVTLRLTRGSLPIPGFATEESLALTPPKEYEVLGQLGRGGMGVVYLARQRGTEKQVAYKVLTILGDSDPEALARFRGEARTLARLHHPSIVEVYDSGTHLGRPFIAMEFLPGGSLADKLRTGRLGPRQAAAFIADVASAVGHAHSQGIIHRDLKPSNILLDTQGRPKVADFGLARDVVGEQVNGGVTRTGTVAGTPGYMPPEQLAGKKELTPAVDVWALGVILYEMIAGAVPFPGADHQQIFANVLRHEPLPLRVWQPAVPRDLETICLKCLQKESQRRYASAAELADDLERFLNNRAIVARPVGYAEKSIRWCRRNPAVAGMTATVMLTLAVASVVSVAFAARASRDRAGAVEAARTEAELRRQAEAATAAEKGIRRDAEAMTTMLDSLLASVTPGQDALASLRQEMDRTARSLNSSTNDPLIKARLLSRLALTRQRLGDSEEAVAPLEQAYAIRKETLGAEDALTVQTAHDLGYAYIAALRYEDSVRIFQPIVAAREAVLPADAPELVEDLSYLMTAYNGAGRHKEADALGERVVAICARQYGEESPETLWRQMNLRRNTVAARRFEESIPLLKKAYACFKAKCDPNSVQVICARAELGRSLLENGQPHEALPYLVEMYGSSIVRTGPTHPFTVIDRNDLARAYEACGLFAEAASHRRELSEHFKKIGDAERAEFQAKLLAQDLAGHQ